MYQHRWSQLEAAASSFDVARQGPNTAFVMCPGVLMHGHWQDVLYRSAYEKALTDVPSPLLQLVTSRSAN
jgi:hypothetical protein